VLVCLTLLSLVGCESAAKHPAITIGTVTGTMGFGLCEISVADVGTCAIVGGVSALALGGITALVYLLADPNAPPDEPAQEETPREYVTEEPPGLPAWMQVDAGVPDAGVPVVDAAVVDGM
jgi:hypothetical protein